MALAKHQICKFGFLGIYMYIYEVLFTLPGAGYTSRIEGLCLSIKARLAQKFSEDHLRLRQGHRFSVSRGLRPQVLKPLQSSSQRPFAGGRFLARERECSFICKPELGPWVMIVARVFKVSST